MEVERNFGAGGRTSLYALIEAPQMTSGMLWLGGVVQSTADAVEHT